ncbi:MAG: hypothetical protein M1453_07765 [Acidobacteria bacterium]|nr:hypothetical protein [Acidobacteriota bacterium]MCL5287872.1 hypothetical protein [Acidobacteriota bacterium]
MSAKIRMFRLALCVAAWSCALATPALAQCPAKTTIMDTLYNADGSLASGRVTIAWPTFLIGTCQVIGGQTTVSVANGAFTVQLYPNTTAVPAGTSYRVTFALKSGRVSTEYWVVPASATSVSLATVRAPSVPVPTVMFGESQVVNLITDLAKKVELPAPCAQGKILESNGSSTPPQVNCVDPVGGSGSQHQVSGANLASNNPVNFQNSSSVAFTNPSAGNVQASLADGGVTASKLAVSNPSTAQLSGIGDSNIAAAALSPNRVSGTAVTQARAINTTSPLTGGGDLSADRTVACPTCEVNTNKGAASGYAALNATSKVVQDPAAAQTAPGASKIPLADGAGKIADGWLSANVSLLGSTVDLASEVAGNLPPANGGTGANNFATSGRYLRADGTSFVTSGVPAAGAGSCTNQFVRATVDNAAPTCATVTSSDVDSSVEKSANKNTPNGYAPLNASSVVPNANLPTIFFATGGASVGTVGAGVTTYSNFTGGGGFNTTESNRLIAMPWAGTCKGFYVRILGSQPASGSLVATLRKNGVDQAVTITIAAGSAAGTFTDTTNSFTFAAGDEISIKFVNNASVASPSISMSIGYALTPM